MRSPDGNRFAFVVLADDGRSLLRVRPVSLLTAHPLPGTDGASRPFRSPVWRRIGVFSGGRLKRINAAGGAPQTICDIVQGRGVSGREDGTILFTANTAETLHRIPVPGGAPAPATKVELQPGRHRSSFTTCSMLSAA